jgi:hypothetical protein
VEQHMLVPSLSTRCPSNSRHSKFFMWQVFAVKGIVQSLKRGVMIGIHR